MHAGYGVPHPAFSDDTSLITQLIEHRPDALSMLNSVPAVQCGASGVISVFEGDGLSHRDGKLSLVEIR